MTIETHEDFEEWFRRKQSRERRDDGRATGFDGSTSIVTSGTVTGLPASNSLTFSMWILFNNTNAGVLIDTTSPFNGLKVELEAGPCLKVTAKRADGTEVLNATCPVSVPNIGDPAVWHNVLFSVRLDATPTVKCYVDDRVLSTLNNTLTPNETIDFSQMDEWFLASDNADLNFFEGGIFDVWVQPGVYFDFDDVNNRRQFITEILNPQILGPSGRRPLGQATNEKPYIYLHGAPEDIRKNRGDMAGTLGGDFNSGSGLIVPRSGPVVRPRTGNTPGQGPFPGTPQQPNLLRWSEEFDQAAFWTPTPPLAILANTLEVTDPLGGNTADKCLNTDQVILQDFIPIVAGQTYTFSIFIQTATSNPSANVKFEMVGNNGVGFIGPGLSQPINASWVRYSYTNVVPAPATLLRVYPTRSGGVGDCYFWGAQVNLGASPSTYQQTV